MSAASAPGFAATRPLALIVDDSPFLAAHLSSLLSSLGVEARVAENAAQLNTLAVEAAVIFVELELFQACGFEVTRELAELHACPLVLLTGSGRKTDLQWGLRAGARMVLPRPVTVATLKTALAKLDYPGLAG